MGIFTRNSLSNDVNYESQIMENTSYQNVSDLGLMMLENAQNEQLMFEAAIGCDFQETFAIQEGYIEEAQIINENAMGGLFERIKDFIKKVWEKIKGIFKSFMAKLDSILMKDGKAFVNKYKKIILSKNLSNFKYKYQEVNKKAIGELGKDPLVVLSNIFSTILKNAIDHQITNREEHYSSDLVEKLNDNVNDGIEEFLGKVTGSSSCEMKDFKKEYEEYFFTDSSPQEEEGLSASLLTDMMTTISDKNLINDMDKKRKDYDKFFNQLLKLIEKEQKNVLKNLPKGALDTAEVNLDITNGPKLNSRSVGKHLSNGASYSSKINKSNHTMLPKDNKTGSTIANNSEYNSHLQVMQTATSKIQQATNMTISSQISCTQKHIAQCRGILAKIVSYNDKKINESALLEEFAYDGEIGIVMSDFEQYI